MWLLALFAFDFEIGEPDTLVMISRMPAGGVELSDQVF